MLCSNTVYQISHVEHSVTFLEHQELKKYRDILKPYLLLPTAFSSQKYRLNLILRFTPVTLTFFTIYYHIKDDIYLSRSKKHTPKLYQTLSVKTKKIFLENTSLILTAFRLQC
jgi:hypothetical protein